MRESPVVFVPSKIIEPAEIGVLTVTALAVTVRASIPDTVSVPEPSPNVTSPEPPTLISKLSSEALIVLLNEMSSVSPLPVVLRAMAEPITTPPLYVCAPVVVIFAPMDIVPVVFVVESELRGVPPTTPVNVTPPDPVVRSSA